MGKRGPKGTSTNKRAISSRAKNALDNLSLKNQDFCRFYTMGQTEFFGNGVRSYCRAYGVKIGIGTGTVDYSVATSRASKLLTNVDILSACNELLELHGLNDIFVDKQLEFLITQNSDFKTKLGGIKEYNVLKGRVSKKLEGATMIFMGDIINAHAAHNEPKHVEATVVEPKQVESQVQVVKEKPTQGSTVDSILEKHGI